MPPTTIEQQLVTLHAHYTSRVNAALAAGRMDLAQDLAEDCRDEALDLMLAAKATPPPRPRSRSSSSATGCRSGRAAAPARGDTDSGGTLPAAEPTARRRRDA